MLHRRVRCARVWCPSVCCNCPSAAAAAFWRCAAHAAHGAARPAQCSRWADTVGERFRRREGGGCAPGRLARRRCTQASAARRPRLRRVRRAAWLSGWRRAAGQLSVHRSGRETHDCHAPDAPAVAGVRRRDRGVLHACGALTRVPVHSTQCAVAHGRKAARHQAARAAVHGAWRGYPVLRVGLRACQRCRGAQHAPRGAVAVARRRSGLLSPGVRCLALACYTPVAETRLL